MNRYIITLMLSVGLQHMVFSQKIDTVFPGLDYIISIKDLDSARWLVVTGDSKIYTLDHLGQILSTKDIAPSVGWNKLIQSYFQAFPAQQDSFFYVTTIDNHCDYFEDFRLFKIDDHGEVLGINLFSYPFQPTGRFIYPDGQGAPDYILYNGNDIIVQYPQDSILSISLGTYIEQIEVSSIGEFAVLSTDTIYYFVKSQDGFQLSNKKVVSPFFNKYHKLYFTSGNHLIWADEKSVILLNPALEILKQFTPETGEKIVFSKESNARIINITESIDQELYFNELDTSLHLISRKILGFKNIYVSDLIWSGDSLLTLAGIEFYKDDKTFTFIKQFDFSENTKHQDIGISNLRFDRVIGPGTYHCYGNTTKSYRLENTTIEIINHGNSRIDEATITPAKSYCYFFCDPEWLYAKELKEMNLGPGEKKEFYLGYVGIELDAYESQDSLCLSVILPGNHLDFDHSDNLYCFGPTVGISNIDRKNISFYPNPVFDILHISNLNWGDVLLLYDLDGKVLFNKNGIENSDDEIDVSKLASGLYFLKCVSQDGFQCTFRFVKM